MYAFLTKNTPNANAKTKVTKIKDLGKGWRRLVSPGPALGPCNLHQRATLKPIIQLTGSGRGATSQGKGGGRSEGLRRRHSPPAANSSALGLRMYVCPPVHAPHARASHGLHFHCVLRANYLSNKYPLYFANAPKIEVQAHQMTALCIQMLT